MPSRLGRSWPSRRLPPLVPGCERPPEPASAKAAPAVASPSGEAWLPREEARRGLRLPAAGPRLQPAAPGPPSKPLPAGRGSLPCPRLGSRRSARSPWRRAIKAARPGSALLPAPPPRTALSAPPRSTWDVALAASGEPGRTARWEIVAAAARAAATPQTAPPAASHREGSEPGRQGWSGGRGEAYSCSRESRNTVHPVATPYYGSLGLTRFI